MNEGKVQIPREVQQVLERLEKRGWEACVVGGCVRDSLLGRTPVDWDICTSALPQETANCFSDRRVIETGIQHGTVTVLQEGVACEVTTYRVEGSYTDCRRPDRVQFVRNLHEDLARRDFTVNAMAFHPERGLIDAFEGREDLQAGILRCVGKPEQRFQEDALRILRALRFASVYGFQLEKETAQAARENRERLCFVAAERIQVELCKLLMGKSVESVLTDFPDVMAVFLPEILPAVGFEQRNSYHVLDVWEHTARAVGSAKAEKEVRLALLAHDLGKPECCTQDADGHRHFNGHAGRSVGIAKEILYRLRFDNATTERVLTLISGHDAQLSSDHKCSKRWLNRIGEEAFRQLIEVQRGDVRGQNPIFQEQRLKNLAAAEQSLNEVLAEADCFSLRSLAVKGNDLLALGISPGKTIGEALQFLLNEVVEERLPNIREALLSAAERQYEPKKHV